MSIKISPKQFNDRISIFARLYGYTVAQVFYGQGALLCQWLATQMYPKTEGSGKKAVSKDMDKAFGRIPVNMRHYEKDGKVWFRPKRKDDPRKPFSIDAEWFCPSGDRMAQHHRRFQNKNTGKFMERGNAQNRMYVRAGAKAKYKREIQQHVGRTKSAWLVGMNFCSPKAGTGLVNGSTLKPFILRHDDFSRKYGRVFDGLSQIKLLMGGAYALWLGNDVPWVDKKDARSLLESGVKTRQRDLLYGMWKRMPDAGARAGFKVKAA